MTIKAILVPVSGSDSARATLQTALQIALRFNAHIDVLHVRPDPRGLVPYTGEGMDGSMIEEIMEVTEREGGERASRAQDVFQAFCRENEVTQANSPAGDKVTIAWTEETGREDEVVAVTGRQFDLVVVGRPVRDAALPSPITLEAALLDTGRPIVVAPPEPLSDTGDKIAIAWEGSPEAARAIGDAMPILEQASAVTILVTEAALTVPLPHDGLIERLAWHGVEANAHEFESSASDLGSAFLAQAAAVGANMLVKGAYSQSRLRQMILGGRTRHILAHATLPVFLAR